MDVLVTGSSGFIASALLPALRAEGHRVVRLVRGDAPPTVDARSWDPEAGTIDAAGIEGVDAVIHLAGAGIGDRRWSPERKRVVLESRTRGTRLVAETLARLERRPQVLVSASGIGFYGNRGADLVTEGDGPGDDFVADVCVQWEAATAPAAEAGIRVVTTRSGIVLAPHGGVLRRLLLPFRLGLGGRQGTGEQYMSWISLDDEVAAYLHVLATPTVAGPVNFTAPNPVTNAEFAGTLGRVLGRPTVFPTPMAPLKARYGTELVRHLLLEGQRVLPTRLLASGFEFRHPTLEEALRSVLGRPAAA